MKRKPTDYAAMTNSPSRWMQLLARVSKMLRPKGAKAALARSLGISRQAVNKWLKNKGAPSAEITLRLLEWVTKEEAKQQTKKHAGSAVTRPALKTRTKRKSINEKPVSSGSS